MATRENQGLQAIVIVLTILTIGLLRGPAAGEQRPQDADGARRRRRRSSQHGAARRRRRLQAEAQQLQGSGSASPKTDDASTPSASVRGRHGKRMAPTWPQRAASTATVLDNISRGESQARRATRHGQAGDQDADGAPAGRRGPEGSAGQEVRSRDGEGPADDAAERAEVRTAVRDASTPRRTTSRSRWTSCSAAHDEAIAKLERREDAAREPDRQARAVDRQAAARACPTPTSSPSRPTAGSRGSNQRNGKVWINLGSADGLRPQVTFSVAEAGLDDAAAAEKKGSIEVMRILGPAHGRGPHHLRRPDESAACRATASTARCGTAAGRWASASPGSSTSTRTGKSDLEQAQEHHRRQQRRRGRRGAGRDGQAKQGELKVDTRYLVLGEYPNGRSLRQSCARAGRAERRGGELGVETIALDEFLKLMGWQRDTRSVAMAPASRPEDFPPEPRGQEMPRKTRQPAGVFEKRLPTGRINAPSVHPRATAASAGDAPRRVRGRRGLLARRLRVRPQTASMLSASTRPSSSSSASAIASGGMTTMTSPSGRSHTPLAVAWRQTW